jgi:CO/xanthine dehydrogenase FAD-binding subunit
MKAAPFEFRRARSAAEACALLAQHGADAKIIAGGQSLVPMMAMRLARPAFLVDINEAEDLSRVEFLESDILVGATARQSRLERDARLAERIPLLRKALRWVGHAQTRNRGTLGGSMVHADPSAELPLAACVLDAALVLRDENGESEMPAREFILAPMVTAIAPDQCLAAIRFPLWPEARVGCAFEEVSLRHGDFALVSAAAQVALDADNRCVRAAIGTASAPLPQAHPGIAGQMAGRALDDKAIEDIAAEVARAVQPDPDLHASAQYRRHLAGVLTRRALVAARDEAMGKA